MYGDRDAGSVDGVRYEYAGRSVRVTTSAVSALKVCNRVKKYIIIWIRL